MQRGSEISTIERPPHRDLRVDACRRCTHTVLLIVVGSVIVFGIIDHLTWSLTGFEPSIYHGSTLRSLRELVRPGNPTDDSWRPMIEALHVLRSPDGDNLYETIFFGERIKFQYPPTSLIWLAALEPFGLANAHALNAINALVFLAGIIGVVHLTVLLRRDEIAWEGQAWGTLLLIMLAALLFYPTIQALKLGQIQVWINTLFIFACVAWLRGSRAAAGALLALAATIKPQLGVFLVWALLWREWSFLRGFLAAGLPLGILSLFMFGINNHLSYFKVLSYISQHGEAFFTNHSINGIVHRALGNGTSLGFDHNAFPPADARVAAATLIASLILLAVALVPAALSGGQRPTIVDFAVAAICSTIASPIAWEHHYGVLLPIFAITLTKLCSAPGRVIAVAALTIAWVLSANNLPAANYLIDTPLSFMQAYLLLAALILLGLLLWLRREAA